MSFIPHRDVFDMSDEDIRKIGDLFDELEGEFVRDSVKDEYGPDWTPERVYVEYGHWHTPYFGAYSALVYLYARMKRGESRTHDE